jgi:hypothetical protein
MASPLTLTLRIPAEILDKTNRAFAKAEVSALNKMAAQAKTFANREIRSTYNVRAGLVSDSIRIKRASSSNPKAALQITGKRLSLALFSARQTAKGVTFAVFKGARKLLPHRFIIKKFSGGVFERLGKSRFPIRKLSTLSVPQMFKAKRVMPKIDEFVDANLPRIYNHELKFYLSK